MKVAFQMLDEEKNNHSRRNPFIVHLTLLFWFFFILHLFADQILEFVSVSLFFIYKFCHLYQYG